MTQANMTFKTLLCVVAVLCTNFSFVVTQKGCSTASGDAGQCVSIYDCQSLLSIVNKPDQTQQDVDYLKKSHCGFVGSTPQVCCPGPCSTPDGAAGSCLSIYSCPHLLAMLTPPVPADRLEYIQRSRCSGADKYSVCCGPAQNDAAPSPSPSYPGQCSLGALPPKPSEGCCGVQNNNNRIIGGTATTVDEYPWLLLVEYVKNNKIKLLCGGALISGRYALTAGHCVVGPVLSLGTPTNVRLGEYDTTHAGPDCTPVEGGGEDCTQGLVIIPIERSIPHPAYNPSNNLRRHDIALLRLAQLAPYTDFIRPICLPTSDATESPPRDFRLFVAGWGAVNSTHSSSVVKLHVQVPYLTAEQCQPAYKVPRRNIPLWKGQICAGGEKGKDSCKGDSGGPLMFDTGKNFEMIGIVSFGPTPCGLEDIPGVYTKVYEYDSWIRDNIYE